MPCNDTIEFGIKKPADCKCYKAVMRVYSDLIGLGDSEVNALDAAKIVYGYHHPEDSQMQQCLTVERWINAESQH